MLTSIISYDVSFQMSCRTLANISCACSTNLYFLLKGKQYDARYLQEFVSYLKRGLAVDTKKRTYHIDPRVLVIINSALEKACLCPSAKDVPELIKHADQMVNRLETICEDPETMKRKNPKEIREMRKFFNILYDLDSASITAKPRLGVSCH